MMAQLISAKTRASAVTRANPEFIEEEKKGEPA